MPPQVPTHIKVRVEFVVRPKKKVTVEGVSRNFLPWSEVSHEMEVTLGNPDDVGTIILCVDKNSNPTREWFFDNDVFNLVLGPETEILSGSGWVKLTYTFPEVGEVHTDTACYPVDASTTHPVEELADPEFTLRQAAPDDIRLSFPLDPGAAPICPQLGAALAVVNPNTINGALYRMAWIANRC